MASIPEGFEKEPVQPASVPEGFEVVDTPQIALTDRVRDHKLKMTLAGLEVLPDLLSTITGEVSGGLAGLVGLGKGLAREGAENLGLVEEQPGGAIETAEQFRTATRDFIASGPDEFRDAFGIQKSETAQNTEQGLARLAEGLQRVARTPVAGIAGLTTLLAPIPGTSPSQSIERAANRMERMTDEGIGPVIGEGIFEATGSPGLATTVEVIPTAIASFFGLRGPQAARTLQVSDELAAVLRRRGVDPSDASPENMVRVREVVDELNAARDARIQVLEEAGIDNPTRAQVTRSADDFQLQQELVKRETPVAQELRAQDAAIERTFDDAVDATAGRPGASGNSVIDEVVGRSTRLDDEISALYRQAREQGTAEVDLARFADHVMDNIENDGLSQGFATAVRGELRRRGVIDSDGNVIGRVDVDTAENIRIFMNQAFDPQQPFRNNMIRDFKNFLDDDVFRAAGNDIFAAARGAKRSFEEGLSAARVSRFDTNQTSLVRDILENRIDPERLVEIITSRTSRYRTEHLRQLRGYLQQTDEGIAAFDDLRRAALRRIFDNSLRGPVDADGFQVVTRASFDRALGQVGDPKLKVLFTTAERRILDQLRAAMQLREPVRGTATGRGPSAQALQKLEAASRGVPFLREILENMRVRADNRLALRLPEEVPQPRAQFNSLGAAPAVVESVDEQ